MAIPFQSELNNIVATGVQNATGSAQELSLLSGGTMPEPIRNLIANTISEYLSGIDTNIPANIPSEVYNIVAGIMLPFTPSLSLDSLTSVLKSNSVFGNISSGTFDVGSIIDDQLNMFINQYEQKLLEMTGGFDAVLGQFGIGDNLAGMVSQLTGSVKAVVDASLGSILSPADLSNVSPDLVATFLQGSGTFNIAEDLPQISSVSGNPLIRSLLDSTADEFGNVELDSLSAQQRDTYAAAYIKGASGTDVPIDSLIKTSGQIRGTIAGTIDQTEELPSPNAFLIDADTINPEGSFISSVEELEAEMSSITREVSEVVVHWSETYTNANLSAAQLTELTGAGDNAYHFIIRRDGSVERGLPLNVQGNHCDTLGHNKHSIGVCFVGGLNTSSGSKNLYEVASSRSITLSQYNSFYQIMRVFFQQFPGGQALGHMDIDPNQEDPGFDVRDYVFNNFNKSSLYTNPYEQTAFSPKEVIQRLEEPRVSENGLILSTPSALNKETDVLEKTF